MRCIAFGSPALCPPMASEGQDQSGLELDLPEAVAVDSQRGLAGFAAVGQVALQRGEEAPAGQVQAQVLRRKKPQAAAQAEREARERINARRVGSAVRGPDRADDKRLPGPASQGVGPPEVVIIDVEVKERCGGKQALILSQLGFLAPRKNLRWSENSVLCLKQTVIQ